MAQSDFMKSRFSDWLSRNGVNVAYTLSTGEQRQIKGDFEASNAAAQDTTRGKYYARSAVVRILDDGAAGVLRSEVRRHDRLQIAGETWLMQGEGQHDGAGMLVLDLVRIQDLVTGRVQENLV